MAIRDVKPFDDKQWNQLQENMKRGASEKQIKNIKKAKRRLKRIAKTNFKCEMENNKCHREGFN